MIFIGQGKYKVWMKEERLDDGIVLIIGGGKLSHVGSVVLSEPRTSRSGRGVSCTSQVINIFGHKEEEIARVFAEKTCLEKKVPVLCVCGIHIDCATKKDIKLLISNAKKLLKKYMD
jgi:hypothetical protein